MATGEISVLNLPLKTGSDISNGDYFLFIDDGILSKILKTDLYASVAVGAKGAKGDVGATGSKGETGFTGWSPVLAVVSDGARRVVQVYDWTGSTGTKPTVGQYISTTGFTANIALATDIRGATGSSGTGGTAGTAGTNGWSPVLAVITDGDRRVLQVYDWVGGTGTKPATGQYLSTTGLTSVLADASNVRGAVGATGAASLTVSAPIASTGGNTPTISIAKATTTVDGYLAAADWNTFNSKVDLTTAQTLTNKTLVAPALGTPVSGVMTNVTGLPTTGLVDLAVTREKIADGAVSSLKLQSAKVPYIGIYDYATYDRTVYSF